MSQTTCIAGWQNALDDRATRFDAVDRRLEAVDERLDRMDRRFDRLDGQIELIVKAIIKPLA
jgi:hypothetical protein